MTLRDKALRVYQALVTAPNPLLLVPAALVHVVSAFMYLESVYVTFMTLLSFTIVFMLNAKPSKGRLAGLMLYTSPISLLSAISGRFFNEGTPYSVNMILAPLTLGVGGLKSLTLYVLASTSTAYIIARNTVKTLIAFLTNMPAFIVAAILGSKGLKLTRGALLAWMDDNPGFLERSLETMGVNKEVKWRMLCLETCEGRKAIVDTGVHFGPFKNVGSSLLPTMLLQKSNGAIVAVHGCGSHELNVVSKEHVDKLVNSIVQGLDKCKPCTPLEPLTVSKGSWVATVIGCIENPTIILSNIEGADDLPCIDSVDNVMLVDAHNKERADEPDYSELYQFVTWISNTLKPCNTKPRCCFKIFHMDAKLARSVGCCSNWIAVVKYCCGGNCTPMVILPANNVDRQASSLYRQALGDVIIVTIDDHSCAAEFKEGVKPLQWSEEFASVLRRLLDECQPEICEVGYSEGTCTVKVWGIETLRFITQLLDKGQMLRLIPPTLYIASIILAMI